MSLSRRASTGSGGENQGHAVSGDGDAIVVVRVVGGIGVKDELASRLPVAHVISATETSMPRRERMPKIISVIVAEATAAKP